MSFIQIIKPIGFFFNSKEYSFLTRILIHDIVSMARQRGLISTRFFHYKESIQQ